MMPIVTQLSGYPGAINESYDLYAEQTHPDDVGSKNTDEDLIVIKSYYERLAGYIEHLSESSTTTNTILRLSTEANK